MYDKHLQKTLEREDARNQEWYDRQRKNYNKVFFYEPSHNKTPLENKILSLQAEIQFLQEEKDHKNNTINLKKSRIKKVQQKLDKLKTEYPEVFLTL